MRRYKGGDKKTIKFVNEDDTENDIFANTGKDCFGIILYNYSGKSFNYGKEGDPLIIADYIWGSVGVKIYYAAALVIMQKFNIVYLFIITRK